MTYYPTRISSSMMLPVAVAKCGVRSALRTFLRHSDVSFVAIVAVPDGEAFPYYEHAAGELLEAGKSTDVSGEDPVLVTSVLDFGDLDARPNVLHKFRNATRIVVFVPSLDNLPWKLRVIADHVFSIGPPSAEHYRAAAHSIRLAGLTQNQAEFLACQPFDAIRLAFRKGRPLLTSMRRLKREAVEKPPANTAPKLKPAMTLEDMHGYGEAKNWGVQLAQDIDGWRQSLITWDDVDRGALLYGPPGCGKTIFAKGLAGSCGVELVVASAARWQAKGHLGDYLKAMRSSFDEARRKSPAILFIDEFDSIGSRESATGSDHHDYKRQAINALLECLDPSEGREGVVVVGATNDLDAIDPALLRAGRLEVTIEIPLPDDMARTAILRQHLRGHKIDGDLASFVSASRGWSGADIEKLARDARRLSRRYDVPMSENALMTVLPARRALSATEMRRMAVHEAGHALVCVLLSAAHLTHVYIEDHVSENGAHQVLGKACFTPQEDVVRTIEFYLDRIAMLLGGIAAETVVYGGHCDGAGGAANSDLALASDIATMIERHFGLGESLLVDLGKGRRPLEGLRARDVELRRLVDVRLKAQFERVTSILCGYRAELEHLVELLVTKGRVEGDEVRAVVHPLSRITASVAT
jgi:SpoVK/Ycf46/Vps4 family AAA+-type ATPase